jgi:superfamily II DNA/RNA helicase
VSGHGPNLLPMCECSDFHVGVGRIGRIQREGVAMTFFSRLCAEDRERLEGKRLHKEEQLPSDSAVFA